MGYFLDEESIDLTRLDTSFFSFRQSELNGVDPQIRQMLEVTRECLENAGETNYRGKRIGYYVGTFGDDWLLMQTRDTVHTSNGSEQNLDLLLANRASYEFDLRGPSMGRGETINAVFIKRLDDAIRDGNPIRAVIRASGTTANGRGVDGLFAPDIAAQSDLMRSVYKAAGLDPLDTSYIECHGTGTCQGDKKEAIAVGEVFRNKGIYMGSAKPNVGHSGGASRLTSLIKAVILENRIIPPQPKFHNPNPNIPFEEKRLRVPVEPTPWPSGPAERISINSFGIGGSNIHAIVEFVASFRPDLIDNRGIAAPEAGNVLDYQSKHPERVRDLSYTLALHREALAYRSFVVVGGKTGSEIAPAVKSNNGPAKIVMVFSGQGAQWPRMGLDLMVADAEFRTDLESMNSLLQQLPTPPSWSLQGELAKIPETSRIYEAELSQPLCTALQIALVRSLRRKGISLDAVIGNSSGEIAAAYAAGALTMEEAITISYYRGFAMKDKARIGAMAAVGIGAAEMATLLIDGVVIAAENSPNSTTISGDLVAIEAVMALIRQQHSDVLCKKLAVDTAYHSHHMIEPGSLYHEYIKAALPDYKNRSPDSVPHAPDDH
ncbi:thiolase-like protein [Podospora australis]|uniref:Thiolase-like protein n=1 Tax=Podospora australis TaxID=1536484 RepID=A0AAN6WKS8_9PEZI|nr:thiolase-like protein [Podospora australis]